MTKQFFKQANVDVDKLIPYAMNAKEHPPEQIAALAANIREFGFTSPVLIDENQNLIAGHGRVLAAQKLQMKKIPAITVTGLDDRKRRALIISDNKLAETSWDQMILLSEMKDISEEFGSIMGFSDAELMSMFAPEIDQENKTESEEQFLDNELLLKFSTETELQEWYEKALEAGVECKVL